MKYISTVKGISYTYLLCFVYTSSYAPAPKLLRFLLPCCFDTSPTISPQKHSDSVQATLDAHLVGETMLHARTTHSQSSEEEMQPMQQISPPLQEQSDEQSFARHFISSSPQNSQQNDAPPPSLISHHSSSSSSEDSYVMVSPCKKEFEP